ncbi:MAG: archaetidylserine decarboxylase [Panacagrimonas sp.]
MIGDHLFALVQRCLPTRLLSWLMFKLTRIESVGFKNAFIRTFMRLFSISLAEAEHPRAEDYPHFNAFFTRALREGTRALDEAPDSFVSPVDGRISQLGRIDGTRIFQAKGHTYTAAELLGDERLAVPFEDGGFCTIYLAPNNYHRIHMPADARLREWLHVPGRLFSVNPATARAMPGLFARNERVVAIFDTAFGPLAMVLVGALFVGSMETVWAGLITPPHRRSGITRRGGEGVALGRGHEMGRFNMGSTVILLAGPGALDWETHLGPGAPLRVGERIGQIRTQAP